MDYLTESNHQKLIFFVYLLTIYKSPSLRFWCYRVYLQVCVLCSLASEWSWPDRGKPVTAIACLVTFCNHVQCARLF